MGLRKRCTECRQWYEASSSARDTQRVCGEACRQMRRRKLARQRRQEHLLEARDEERERQRAHRAALWAQAASAAATETLPAAVSSQPARDGPRGPARHAPPSSANHPEVLGKVLECWDREMARSRATLQRRIAGILRGSSPSAGTARDGSVPLSRATLDP